MKNDKRILKVIFNRTGSGSLSTKLALPKDWCNSMGLSQENREVVAIFSEKDNHIIIKPLNKIE